MKIERAYQLIVFLLAAGIIMSLSTAKAQLETDKIHQLRGMQDAQGTTHLYYRLYRLDPPNEYLRNDNNSIYHFNTDNQSDSLFLVDEEYYGDIRESVETIVDYEFMNKNPATYIVSGYGGLPDPTWYISYKRKVLTGGYYISINDLIPDPAESEQMYLQNGARIHKTDNKGWQIDSTLVDSMSSSFYLLSINSHDDELLFGIKNGNLARSDWNTDTTVIKTDWSWSRNTEFYYSDDSTLVFARDYKKGDYQKILASVIYRSRDSGKSGTWQRIRGDSAFIAFDSNRRGSKVYMSIDSSLLVSDDYGTEFESVEQFDKRITGIFKPDTSNAVLYVSTISDIWKLVNEEKVKSVKHVIADISDQKPFYSYNYKLADNYPNPFNPSTNIRFKLPIALKVMLTVYNSIGKKIKTLVNRQMTAGSHSITFNAEGLPSGVYIYRLKAGDYSESRKMLLVK